MHYQGILCAHPSKNALVHWTFLQYFVGFLMQIIRLIKFLFQTRPWTAVQGRARVHGPSLLEMWKLTMEGSLTRPARAVGAPVRRTSSAAVSSGAQLPEAATSTRSVNQRRERIQRFLRIFFSAVSMKAIFHWCLDNRHCWGSQLDHTFEKLNVYKKTKTNYEEKKQLHAAISCLITSRWRKD